jgi:hypothetical protein
MPIKRSNISSAQKAQALLASRKQAASGSKKRTHAELVKLVASGAVVDELLEDLKRYGVNEQLQPLQFYRLFEEGLRLVGDLRIGCVYTTGVAQFAKTITNSLVNAWFGQRLGLVSSYVWPLQSSVDVYQPQQHRPLLDHFALTVSKAKVVKTSSSSNRLYSVGIGRNIFHAASKGSAVQNADNAEVGAASASYTADCVFMEEASQINQKLISPLISRVEKSVSPQSPQRILGTMGGGAGIELSIAQNAEYQFEPYCHCTNCGEEAHLHPFGTILKSHIEINPVSGEPEEKFLSNTGNVSDWFTDENDNPIIVCNHCQQELDDASRLNSYFKCIKSGLTVPEFLEQVVIPEWETRRIQISINFTCSARQKPGRLVARAIIDESRTPSNLADFIQQRLGFSSSALGGSISQDNINSAFARYPLVKGTPITIMGVDQGRQNYYVSCVQFRHDETLSDPQELWNSVRANVLFLDAVPSTELPNLISQYKVQAGCIDSKPSIAFAHQIREETGLVLGEQFANMSISDDIRPGIIKDAGMEFPVFKFRTSKPARAVMDAFISGRISLHPDLQQHNDLRPDSFARHLRAVSWDSEIASIKKSPDGRDDLFFSLMFAFLAYSIYIQDPQEILMQSWSWWK